MTDHQQLQSPFRPDCLEGKVAIVTGGGSGICYEITRQLLRHGCRGAVICGRREQFLSRAAEALSADSGRTCLYKACDVRDPNACAAVVAYALERFGRVDVLVNGAAGNFLANAADLTPKGFRTVMEIDALGTYNMSHAAHPALRASGRGSIINISATLQKPATWYQVHASAAKAAVDSITRSLALEWGADGIRVNGIAPGPIEGTPGMTKLSPGIDGDEMNDMVSEGIPLGRMGRGFDIGMASVFLSSEGSGSYVTGDVLIVDGGHWLYKPPMIEKDTVAIVSRKVEGKSRAQAPKLMSKL
jgi:peroxisomal 2,4-dienoyl-CoA reductase